MSDVSLYLFDGSNLFHAGRFGDRDELVDQLASFVAVRGARGASLARRPRSIPCAARSDTSCAVPLPSCCATAVVNHAEMLVTTTATDAALKRLPNIHSQPPLSQSFAQHPSLRGGQWDAGEKRQRGGDISW